MFMRDVARWGGRQLFRLLFGEWPADNRDRLALQLNRSPLVAGVIGLTSLLGALLPARNRSGLFFFFPFFHMGGAERVHADILACFTRQQPWVVFTKRSSSRAFLPLFQGGARLLNLWPLCKYLYPVSVGLAAGFINRHSHAVVFGANSLFYALLIPYLKPHVRCCDLIHAFGAGVEEFTLPAAPRLDRRVVISRQTARDLEGQYAAAGLDPGLVERIVLIENRVPVPELPPPRSLKGPLEVLFVGRGSAEKRIHLIGRAARQSSEGGLPVRFTLLGDVADWLDPGDAPFCRLAGPVVDEQKLRHHYEEAQLLLITSTREGFPLTVMEGMAQGCVPLCSAVGGIPEHIRQGINGMLLPAGDDEALVAALCRTVAELDNDRQLLARLSAAAHLYARQHFGGAGFCEKYRREILGP